MEKTGERRQEVRGGRSTRPAEAGLAFGELRTLLRTFGDSKEARAEGLGEKVRRGMLTRRARPYEGDFSRNRVTGIADLAILSDAWLTDNGFMDLAPRRAGDGIVNFAELALPGRGRLEGSSR